MMTSSDIRNDFLRFFHSKGHLIVPSAPIVVKNDPTLLFTNAGMNQFKDYFLGNNKSSAPRVVDTQKCLRVSGKHNDLEEVGVDTYHHTMFEMLGNWSFGDYFKEQAIAWSWELLTSVYQIDKSRIYVTVFEGDEKEKLPKDEEAISAWIKWIGEERILLGNKKDNFWEMGDTGPCGPCTEIHVDCRSDGERAQVDGKTLVNAEHPQVIEIWNNVFIQFNRLRDGSLEPLPAKHVDTGMGLERLVRVLQNKQSNYDTDLFTGTIAEVEEITGRNYLNTDTRQDIAFRVLADHIRAISFCIADGQLPSNTGAGYVIRRILRRAVRYYYTYLDYRQPLLFQLVPGLAAQFENVFPELEKQKVFVAKVIQEEEDSFLRTIEKGLKRIDDLETVIKGSNRAAKEAGLKGAGNKEGPLVPFIEGKDAFELFDTFGFPLDLTLLIATEKGLGVDTGGFNEEMQKQKTRSRAATAIDTEDWVVLEEDPETRFVGYDVLEIQAKVVKYRKVKAKERQFYQVVLDITPFYAESGGQVGDTGSLNFDGEIIEVFDTKKENDLIIQFTESLPSSNIRATVLAKVNAANRQATAIHHSATHLLHAALQKVLGDHVVQKGSLVNAKHLRFDFAHFAKVTDEELARTEALVNAKIRENIAVDIRQMAKDEALRLGAMALFGEKYGEQVRVVLIDPAYSIELCGGTHVGATGELGIFKIEHETAVAAGVRRIEAVSGKPAEEYVNQALEQLRTVRESLKNPKELNKSIENLITENASLQKHIEHLEARQLVAIRSELLQKDHIIGQVNFIGSLVEVPRAEALKKLCFDLKNHLRDFVVVLCANIDGRAFVAISIADNVVAAKNLDASRIIKEQVAPLIKGGGGGQKTLATAGGQDTSNLQAVIELVKDLL